MEKTSDTIDEKTISWKIPELAHSLKIKMEKRFKEYDITTEQWATLSRLYNIEGCNQKKLAEVSSKNGATITRLLNVLEDKKLVKRKNSPNDKREYLIYLTKKGKNTYKNARKVAVDHNHELESILTKQELKKLILSLDKLISYINNINNGDN